METVLARKVIFYFWRSRVTAVTKNVFFLKFTIFSHTQNMSFVDACAVLKSMFSLFLFVEFCEFALRLPQSCNKNQEKKHKKYALSSVLINPDFADICQHPI